MTEAGGRTGRRTGKSDTRAQILDSARKLFSSNGFAQTSMRSVATDAGVDVALISHYFGNKRGLFLEVVELPVDPVTVLAPLAEVPIAELGVTMLRQILTVWDSPAGPAAVAAFRTAMAGGEDTMLREFMLNIVLTPLRDRIEDQVEDVDTRLSLVASQIAGLLVVRKVIGVEPIASMPVEDVVRQVGPNVQRYLTGDLGSPGGSSPL
ncbi:TetR/AcrR family transcriptional regulator [Luteipulveratus mongoliensis]|uniref:TetR family transcriptional regulator n=1 Tax=Luteipulveratus mongoliensis TaxID=571913 RepID=A0A0K1JLJ2_9MICO|nr:TetR/AcrR family transcriptional regulator [Luteipulveratus mongoliensis]AKU17594.1 TetR family transcriptional regulator [Luteipulveratus mongoliensis]